MKVKPHIFHNSMELMKSNSGNQFTKRINKEEKLIQVKLMQIFNMSSFGKVHSMQSCRLVYEEKGFYVKYIHLT